MPLFPVTVQSVRAGAFQAAREAGYRFQQAAGRTMILAASDAEAVACNAFLAAYDDVAARKRELRFQLRAEIERRLTQDFSLAELIAIGGTALALTTKNSGLLLANWPAEDLTVLAQVSARFERATAIHLASMSIEGQIAAATTLADLRDIDPTDDGFWPA